MPAIIRASASAISSDIISAQLLELMSHRRCPINGQLSEIERLRGRGGVWGGGAAAAVSGAFIGNPINALSCLDTIKF